MIVNTATYLGRPGSGAPPAVPSQPSVWGPAASSPWKGVVTTEPACSMSSRTGTSCVSSNENVTESSSPSPFGERTAGTGPSPLSVRSTVRGAVFVTLFVPAFAVTARR